MGSGARWRRAKAPRKLVGQTLVSLLVGQTFLSVTLPGRDLLDRRSSFCSGPNLLIGPRARRMPLEPLHEILSTLVGQSSGSSEVRMTVSSFFCKGARAPSPAGTPRVHWRNMRVSLPEKVHDWHYMVRWFNSSEFRVPSSHEQVRPQPGSKRETRNAKCETRNSQLELE
jgi:hypothetical protein